MLSPKGQLVSFNLENDSACPKIRLMAPFTKLEKQGLWNIFYAVKHSDCQSNKVTGIHFDKDKFEEFKTRLYTLEGWNTETGYPERATLEGLGLADCCIALAAVNKLGAGTAAADDADDDDGGGGGGGNDNCFIQTVM